MSNLCICFFTSTKGHFGNRDIYKYSLQKLAEQLNTYFYEPEYGISLLCHIKHTKIDFDYALVMRDEILKIFPHAFIIFSEGQWSHNTPSHGEEYYKDMFKVYGSDFVHESEYVLHLEDDWLFSGCGIVFKGLINYLEAGVFHLRVNRLTLAVRFNHDINQDVSKATLKNDFFYQNEDYTPYGPTLTFQPTIMRTRDWWLALLMIQSAWEKIKGQHCELISGWFMKQLPHDGQPFAFFDPSAVNCQHIGIPDFDCKI
jgi:hypothetical protein